MDCLIRRSPRQVHTILDLDVFVQLHNLLLIHQIVQQVFFQNQVFYYDEYYLMMTYWKKNIELHAVSDYKKRSYKKQRWIFGKI